MGLIKTLYNKIALVSPYSEIILRKFYWQNVGKLKKFNPNKVNKLKVSTMMPKADFEKIIDWIKLQGIREGDLLIVHSGYGELERTGLSPDDIIDRLLQLLGPKGTLAMPVIRRYKDMEKAAEKGEDLSKLTFKYNVRKTMVISGMLPFMLMQREGAIVSHHPFNPLCAIGPLAKEMMSHNLEGDTPSPHGPNSSWRFCYDHGVKVCSIGTDIEHHNTIGHILEESFGNWYWPDKVWYDYFDFEIIDEQSNHKHVVVSNRKDEWGKFHLAELNVTNAQIKAGIMISSKVEGITVGYVDPQKMVPFMQRRNQKGYPYFIFPWEK